MKTIVCLKHGSKYSSDYVNKLYNMIERNISSPFKLVCLTENSSGIDPRVEIVSLPVGLDGWWYKPWVFSKDIGLEGTILYVDLDIVIAGSIDKLFTYAPGSWCTIRDFTRSMRPDWKKYNSSVIRFEAGQLEYIWKEFKRDSKNLIRKFFGDQDYLYHITHQDNPATFFPDEWIQSWKWEIRKTKELSSGPRGERKLVTIENVVPPQDCCITVFHGDPNPHNCLDPWVVDNWR